MKYILASFLCMYASMTLAQEAVELLLFGAVVENADGTPVASATVVAGNEQTVQVVTSKAVLDQAETCLKTWPRGICQPLENPLELAGVAGLIVADVAVSRDDQLAKYNSFGVTRQALVGTYDPSQDGGVTFQTQSVLGEFVQPLDLAMASGQADGMILLQNSAFSPLSIGAPVAHPQKGLVGVIAKAANGAGGMIGIDTLIRALESAGIEVPELLRPSGTGQNGLPARVESEIGRVYVFSDYTDLGYIGGFYGPSGGSGFDETFVSEISFSVWAVNPESGAVQHLAGGDKTVPLVPVGMSLEAQYRKTPGEYLASCVVHKTPASQDKEVFLLQLWRSPTNRIYDEAAPPITGWAVGDTPCASGLATLDRQTLTALSGNLSTPAASADAQAEPLQPSSPTQWTIIDHWNPTGRAAASTTAAGITFTLSCTDSMELILAMSPSIEGARVLLNDLPPYDQGEQQDTKFAFFTATSISKISYAAGGQPTDLSPPVGFEPCQE